MDSAGDVSVPTIRTNRDTRGGTCRGTADATPSERSVKAVMAAGRQSCAAFGSAFGYMVFNEGAFHVPK